MNFLKSKIWQNLITETSKVLNVAKKMHRFFENSIEKFSENFHAAVILQRM